MSAQSFRTFADFYPFYLGEHANPMCRRLHFIGTSIAAVIKAISRPAIGAISGPGGRNGHRRRPDMR